MHFYSGFSDIDLPDVSEAKRLFFICMSVFGVLVTNSVGKVLILSLLSIILEKTRNTTDMNLIGADFSLSVLSGFTSTYGVPGLIG